VWVNPLTGLLRKFKRGLDIYCWGEKEKNDDLKKFFCEMKENPVLKRIFLGYSKQGKLTEEGRFSAVDLLIKIACFVKKWIIFLF
jgi:hypothetical protein